MPTIYKAIGQKIKELRTGRPDLSQEKLAGALGTTANTVSRWETAQYRPSVDDLDKVSRYFGVPLTVFFPDIGSDPKIQMLLSATGDLDSSDLDEIVRYAQFRRARRELKRG
jgi:transcriptional regulator with XRE-family HTH domain